MLKLTNKKKKISDLEKLNALFKDQLIEYKKENEKLKHDLRVQELKTMEWKNKSEKFESDLIYANERIKKMSERKKTADKTNLWLNGYPGDESK